LIHSDQGTHYWSDAWRHFCRDLHLESSVSRKGSHRDSAVVESFFASLKKERVKKHPNPNRELAVANVTEFIDFYNRTRRNSQLGGINHEQLAGANNSRRRAVQ
jgi:putative transposase